MWVVKQRDLVLLTTKNTQPSVAIVANAAAIISANIKVIVFLLGLKIVLSVDLMATVYL